MKKSILLLFILFFFVQLKPSPASRDLRTEILPDGTSVSYYVRGDEKIRYVLSTDGYVIMENENGFFYYAEKDENDYLVIGNIIAHNQEERTSEEIAFLKTIPTFLEYHPEQIKAFLKEWEFNDERVIPFGSFSVSSTNVNPNAQRHSKSLVLLVNFSDKVMVVENPREKFSDMLNLEGYDDNEGTGSARDYFVESSFGYFAPDFDVYGPFTLSNPQLYYSKSGYSKQMITEACLKASQAGVDFSLYDTDGDGKVDNVCVIFAGNNSSESSSSLIVPHRSDLGNYNTKYNGKIIFDYMCTSELRGKGATADYMCGIGTFVHEFSHLLGLPDLYNTFNQNSYCLDEWSVMDEGFYNNAGRTPPTFSSYERYFMGWLTPEILDFPTAVELIDLKESNRAYIITKEGTTPNMNGFIPSPTEFFLLENRQTDGFDIELPYHGMVIWHIYYVQNYWNNNRVNANATKGVLVVPADGQNSQASKSGDTFPGTSGTTFYSPVMKDGTIIEKPITNITESVDGIISFDFMMKSGLENIKNELDLNIYVHNETLIISGVERETRIEIFQMDGKKLTEKILSDYSNEIKINKSGIYILKIESENTVSAVKFII